MEFIRKIAYMETEHVNSSNREKIFCEDLVILAAGAINTPHLLMLSGIGPGEHLKVSFLQFNKRIFLMFLIKNI